jgi:hypothetical protein
MRAALLLLAIVLAGCSSEDSSTPSTTTDAATDTAATTDTSTTADSGAADTTTATDGALSCPKSVPMNGDPCTTPGQMCDYPTDCGPMSGDYATCTAGGWSVVRRPCTTGDSGADAASD